MLSQANYGLFSRPLSRPGLPFDLYAGFVYHEQFCSIVGLCRCPLGNESLFCCKEPVNLPDLVCLVYSPFLSFFLPFLFFYFLLPLFFFFFFPFFPPSPPPPFFSSSSSPSSLPFLAHPAGGQMSFCHCAASVVRPQSRKSLFLLES